MLNKKSVKSALKPDLTQLSFGTFWKLNSADFGPLPYPGRDHLTLSRLLKTHYTWHKGSRTHRNFDINHTLKPWKARASVFRAEELIQSNLCGNHSPILRIDWGSQIDSSSQASVLFVTPAHLAVGEDGSQECIQESCDTSWGLIHSTLSCQFPDLLWKPFSPTPPPQTSVERSRKLSISPRPRNLFICVQSKNPSLLTPTTVN